MPQPEYTRKTKVHGVDKPKVQGPPGITAPRIRVRSALRRSPRARQELAVVVALTEEEVMRAHVVNVTELLARTARDTPLEETIAIYMRVLNVPRRDRRIVTARALALLQELVPAHMMRPSTPRAEKGGLLSRFTRRLKGRNQGRLRAHVASATKRAKEEVRQAYLAGADRAVAAMDGLVGPAEAVQLFLERLDITVDWGERIFHEALLRPGAAAAVRIAK